MLARSVGINRRTRCKESSTTTRLKLFLALSPNSNRRMNSRMKERKFRQKHKGSLRKMTRNFEQLHLRSPPSFMTQLPLSTLPPPPLSQLLLCPHPIFSKDSIDRNLSPSRVTLLITPSHLNRRLLPSTLTPRRRQLTHLSSTATLHRSTLAPIPQRMA